MQFIEQVANELGMTADDKSMFTVPKATYTKYCRNVIYDTTKKQINLFENIVTFPKEAVKVRDKQKALIMFLDHYPKYQDRNYMFVWFKMAHDCYLNQCMIDIPNYEFTNRSVNHLEMSFAKKLKNNPLNDQKDFVRGSLNLNAPHKEEFTSIKDLTECHEPIVTEPDDIYHPISNVRNNVVQMQPYECNNGYLINQSHLDYQSSDETNDIAQLTIQFNRLAIK